MDARKGTDHGDGDYELGLRLAREECHAQAIAAFERALEARPQDARVLFALGNTAARLGLHEAAQDFFGRVLLKEPDRVEALVQLANLWRRFGRTADIIALLRPALIRNPFSAELWLTLGSAMRDAGDGGSAAIFYREALRLIPDYPPALGNLADVIADAGGLDEALSLYARAITAEPDNAQARLNRAILLFLKGDLAAGWRDYEYRLDIKERRLVADHGLPRWNGQLREGLRLLVTAEQGVGDQIMFASVVPGLVDSFGRNGGRVILEVEPRLAPLFARSFAGCRIAPACIFRRGGVNHASYAWLAEAGGADAAIPIGSLPRLFRPSLAAFPHPHVYLAPDQGERGAFRSWLTTQGPAPYVGICWRSGNLKGARALQYAPLDAWCGFLRHCPGTLVCLQYDAAPEEIEQLRAGAGRPIAVPPGLDQKQEIDRAAALMANIDVAVSAPTAVAWMTAALGVATLKVLFSASWTAFGSGYEPFAPQCRCIMPAKSGDWANVFAQARTRLIEMTQRS